MNNINRNLPSDNKLQDFTFKERAKCVLTMFLVFLVFILLCAFAISIDSKSITFDIAAPVIVSFISFTYINKKLNNKNNKIKNLIICNGVFFLIEKIFITLLLILLINLRGERSNSSVSSLGHAYVFNPPYIAVYILITLGAVLIFKY